MTRYEKGFFTKCAEYGLTADQAVGLIKRAQRVRGIPQSWIDAKKRLDARNAAVAGTNVRPPLHAVGPDGQPLIPAPTPPAESQATPQPTPPPSPMLPRPTARPTYSTAPVFPRMSTARR